MTERVPTVVNVGGTSRSGSTMLHLMLGNGSGAFACGEVMNWFRPVDEHHFRLECPCGRAPCPVWERIKDVPASRFHAHAVDRLGVSHVVDSSKEISWLIDTRRWARTSGLRTVNVFCWKDPVDLAYSFWKRGQGPWFWRGQFVKYYSRVVQVGLPLLAVRFRRLVEEPGPTLRTVCEAAGLPYEEGMERFWEGEQHHLFGSLGVRWQVESRESRIQGERSFPPEFARHVPAIERTVGEDPDVTRVVESLEAADVAVARVDQGVPPPRHPLPAWYYWQRGKRLYRRHRPRVKDAELSARAASEMHAPPPGGRSA